MISTKADGCRVKTHKKKKNARWVVWWIRAYCAVNLDLTSLTLSWTRTGVRRSSEGIFHGVGFVFPTEEESHTERERGKHDLIHGVVTFPVGRKTSIQVWSKNSSTTTWNKTHKHNNTHTHTQRESEKFVIHHRPTLSQHYIRGKKCESQKQKKKWGWKSTKIFHICCSCDSEFEVFSPFFWGGATFNELFLYD